MKIAKILILSATFGLAAPWTFANQGTTTRVLMVGDSWAEFMWDDRSLRNIFAANGRPDILETGDVTSISGSTAAEWTDPSFLQLITDELAANPTIDTVQLTVGGNDFLAGQSGGGWWTGISEEDKEALYDQILADSTTILNHILSLDPEIEVLVSLYDYPNFVDTLDGVLFFICVPLWQDLGEPTPTEINQAAVELQDRIDALIAGFPRVSTLRHIGLMQSTYGFPDQGIPPGQIQPPGDPTLPSPQEAMRFGGADCFHLRADGYDVLAQNSWDQFYDRRFNGTLFTDGFEAGDTSAWSAVTP